MICLLDVSVGVGYTGGHFIEFIGFLSGPGNFVYYGLKIMEQKIFFEKIQISAFAPLKTGQK